MTPDASLSQGLLSSKPLTSFRKSPAVEVIAVPVKKVRDLSIDYLRTTLTLMVVAHHSILAYTTWAAFNKEHVFRSTAPVVDGSRWIVFNYAENFNDVFFMSLMFFISGIFVYPAVRRHGALTFAKDRLLRLGVPFVVAVCGFMPVALYPSWTLGTHDGGFVAFYGHIARIGFQVGPSWFIWVLLLFDLVVALLLLPGRLWLTGQKHSHVSCSRTAFSRSLRCLDCPRSLISRFCRASALQSGRFFSRARLHFRSLVSLFMHCGLWLGCSSAYPDSPQDFSLVLELLPETGRVGWWSVALPTRPCPSFQRFSSITG